jgi:vitamin K-dependent gamma-carboxylase
VIVFHCLTGALFNIGLFPFIMTSSALILFSPSWPRRLLGRWLGPPPAVEDMSPSAPPLRAILAIIAIHVAVQLALPLRHLVYPGDVLWNEDGMRFAWHVLIREKHGKVTFVAQFADGKRLEIPPRHYLTSRQDREMAGQPDLILQLARIIGRDLASRGFHDFEIHAVTAVSLNGRAPVAMIDPDVDLLHIRDLGPRTWVLPAPQGGPPSVHAPR